MDIVGDGGAQLVDLIRVVWILGHITRVKKGLSVKSDSERAERPTLRYNLTPPLTGESTAPLMALPKCFTLCVSYALRAALKAYSTSPLAVVRSVRVARAISIRAPPIGLICSYVILTTSLRLRTPGSDSAAEVSSRPTGWPRLTRQDGLLCPSEDRVQLASLSRVRPDRREPRDAIVSAIALDTFGDGLAEDRQRQVRLWGKRRDPDDLFIAVSDRLWRRDF